MVKIRRLRLIVKFTRKKFSDCTNNTTWLPSHTRNVRLLKSGFVLHKLIGWAKWICRICQGLHSGLS